MTPKTSGEPDVRSPGLQHLPLFQHQPGTGPTVQLAAKAEVLDDGRGWLFLIRGNFNEMNVMT